MFELQHTTYAPFTRVVARPLQSGDNGALSLLEASDLKFLFWSDVAAYLIIPQSQTNASLWQEFKCRLEVDQNLTIYLYSNQPWVQYHWGNPCISFCSFYNWFCPNWNNLYNHTEGKLWKVNTQVPISFFYYYYLFIIKTNITWQHVNTMYLLFSQNLCILLTK